MDEEFGQFVAARSASLCRTAYLLTGDWQAGEDLVPEALARTYLRRRRLRNGSALEPYTRKVLMSLFLTARRRQWHSELPYAELPGQAISGESDEIADRAGMPKPSARGGVRRRHSEGGLPRYAKHHCDHQGPGSADGRRDHRDQRYSGSAQQGRS